MIQLVAVDVGVRIVVQIPEAQAVRRQQSPWIRQIDVVIPVQVADTVGPRASGGVRCRTDGM
jgi:hypothetical protein